MMERAVGVTKQDVEEAVVKALEGWHTDFQVKRSDLQDYPDRVRLGTGKVESLASRVWTILKHGDI